MNPPKALQEVDEAARRSLSPAALRASHRIGEAWKLDPREVAGLLAMTSLEYNKAVEAPESVVLTSGQFDRAGLLIAIYGALGRLFDRTMADEWPGRPNAAPLFGGVSAVELMQTGGVESMKDVLRYLRAVGQGL